MLSHPTTPTAPKKAVTPRHALLENLIEIVKRHVGDQFLDFTTRIAGALVDVADTGGDVRELQARIRAGNLLRNDHYRYLNLAIKELERSLRQEIAELAPGAKAKPRVLDQPLSLVSLEEMDTKVTLGGISKPFEVQHADALATLNVRLAFLLDRDILRVNQNPFRPDVFLNALQHAWLEFNPDEEAAGLLLGLLKPGLFMELSAMLEELSLTLQRKGVLPGSVDSYKSRKADSHDASSASPARKRKQQAELAQQLRQFFSATQDAPLDPDLMIPDLPDIANLKAGAWAQGAAQGPLGGVPNEVAQRAAQTASKQPLMNYLAQVQQSALPAAGFMAAAGQGAWPCRIPASPLVRQAASRQPGPCRMLACQARQAFPECLACTVPPACPACPALPLRPAWRRWPPFRPAALPWPAAQLRPARQQGPTSCRRRASSRPRAWSPCLQALSPSRHPCQPLGPAAPRPADRAARRAAIRQACSAS